MKWRPMRHEDLDRVIALGDAIHQAYPEEPEVALERFDLFPAGCLTLADGEEITGYVFSHPWTYGDAPKLNTLLGRLPASADTYYLHDIVVAPQFRSRKFGVAGVHVIKGVAQEWRFTRIGLVAVNNSTRFWRANGFEIVSVPGLDENLLSYDDGARYMICALE